MTCSILSPSRISAAVLVLHGMLIACEPAITPSLRDSPAMLNLEFGMQRDSIAIYLDLDSSIVAYSESLEFSRDNVLGYPAKTYLGFQFGRLSSLKQEWKLTGSGVTGFADSLHEVISKEYPKPFSDYSKTPERILKTWQTEKNVMVTYHLSDTTLELALAGAPRFERYRITAEDVQATKLRDSLRRQRLRP